MKPNHTLTMLVGEAIKAADFPSLEESSSPFSLYYNDEEPRGLWRILVGTLPFVTDARLQLQLRAAFAGAPADEILESPFENECPLGFIVARNPCSDLHQLPSVLRAAHRANASPLLIWNPVHIETLPETLDLVFATCVMCGLDGTCKIQSGAVRRRILDQHRHLQADAYSSDRSPLDDAQRSASTGSSISVSFAKRRLLALRRIAEQETTKFKNDIFARIPGDWWAASVAKRGSPFQTLQTHLRSHPQRVRKYLFFTEPENIRAKCSPEAISEKVLRNADKIPSLSRFSGPGLPCWPELQQLIRVANSSLEQPGAAVVALLISAATKAWEITLPQVQIQASCTVIELPVRLWQDSLVIDGTIHRETTKEFVSFTTKAIGQSIFTHLSNPGLNLESEAAAWLAANSRGIKLSTLCATLLYHIPLWAKMPATYFELGLNSLSENRPGWMHYIHYDPLESLPSIARFLSTEFDAGFRCDVQNLKTTGSALCPTDYAVTLLFTTVGEIAKAPIPDGPSHLVTESNVISAGARLAESLLTFTRNFDDFAPLGFYERAWNSNRDIVRHLREKGQPRTVVYTQSLRALLLTLNHALHRRLDRLYALGCSGAAKVSGKTYWFLHCENERLTELPPIHHTVSQSLAAHPRTVSLEYLHRRAMRNFSNTHLRIAGVLPEDAIQAIHDHFPSRARSPRSPDSLRMPLMSWEREIASQYLMDKLDLDWAIR